MADNTPSLFRCTLPSGREIWGPGRLTLRQKQQIASGSRPPTRMPDGEIRRFFDPEALHGELFVTYCTGYEVNWTIKGDDGLPLPRTREAIEGVTNDETQTDIMLGGIEMMKHFYPEYFETPAGAPPMDDATEGESTGASENAPTSPTPEKDGSDSGRKGSRSTSGKTTSSTKSSSTS